MTDILMPRLSDSMESGLLVQWLIEDGGEVQAGDELVEIETDKATTTYEAQASGTLEIVAEAGSTVAVGELIARVGPADRSGAEVAAGVEAADRGAEVAAGVEAADRGGEVAAGVAAGAGLPANGTPAAPAAVGAAAAASLAVGQAAATPLARRLARIHGVMLEGLAGSGPRGRVTKADVLRAAGVHESAPAAVGSASAPHAPPVGTAADGPAQADDRPAPGAPARVDGGAAADLPARADGAARARRRELTRTQRLIAQRMAQSKATIPHFQVQTEVAMDEALALRDRLRECTPERQADDQPAPSLNDLIVKASAIALTRHPLANASYRDGVVELHERVNVGIAVAAEGALIVPTILDADVKSLGQIARESRRLAGRVRSGQVTPAELSGATFTVSNLGMYGMTAIMPVINPPQAAILGVGATRPTLVRDARGEIVQQVLLTLTLSCDHRILYGADAALFVAEIRDLLQRPMRVLL